VSVAAATAVVAVSCALTGTKHRDRRRVLGALGFYAIASVAMSAVSGAVRTIRPRRRPTSTPASPWPGVAFPMAVALAVAPQLVLPGSWALRRTADSEAPEVLHAGAQGRARG
jgi:hypothetical protein